MMTMDCRYDCKVSNKMQNKYLKIVKMIGYGDRKGTRFSTKQCMESHKPVERVLSEPAHLLDNHIDRLFMS